MKSFRRFSSVFILAAGFILTAGGCGSSENSVVEPTELTEEEKKEMEGLQDQLDLGGRTAG